MFTPPRPREDGTYDLKGFSVAGLTDLRNMAENELATITASVTEATVTDEQLDLLEEMQAFVAAANTELDERAARTERFRRSTTIPARTEAEETEEPQEATVTAAATDAASNGFDEQGNKDVADSTPVADVANTPTTIVEATVTASGGTAPRRAVTVADVAPHAPAADIPEGDSTGYTIYASADIPNFPTGTTLDWKTLGHAFRERTRTYGGMRQTAPKTRLQHPLATIRRDFPEDHIITDADDHPAAFGKLRQAAEDYATNGLQAANGWCAPSEPDYSICSPITADGLLRIPERVLRRGGLIHNQGLDFGDFFGGDFVLPIPGYNILTEAQVIADTAKTCVEIPCPDFVDDRLNVAALCLTSSLLQNRGYPEFVSEFMQGAIAAMAHLVNREVINEIATGSTAVDLSAAVPWTSENTTLSKVLSAVEFAVKDLRYVYRSSQNQRFDVVLPYWLQGTLRADYIRRNAAADNDIADAAIAGMFAVRGANVQWVYDWQDAFNPGAIPAANQMGAATPPTHYPFTLQFLVYLPGTWVLGRQDVIRLDTVYDSTNLQQNLVTQLFMEDGFKPMRMCQHSRLYTITICPSGNTGAQSEITCTVTP